MSPCRSTVPICSGASRPASRIATPLLGTASPNTRRSRVPRSHRTSCGNQPEGSSHAQRPADAPVKMENRGTRIPVQFKPVRGSPANSVKHRESAARRRPLRGRQRTVVTATRLCVGDVALVLSQPRYRARPARSTWIYASFGKCRRLRCSRRIATRARRGRRSHEVKVLFSDS